MAMDKMLALDTITTEYVKLHAENEKLKAENEELTDKLDSAKTDAEMAREDMHAERELAQKLQAWKESAKQEHLAAGTWVSQAREEELNDKIKSLESTLRTERTMTEHGYLRGSSTGDCVWYSNLEALRKERDGWEKSDSLMREENEKLKQFVLGVHNNIYGTKYDDEDIVDSMDLNSIMEECQ